MATALAVNYGISSLDGLNKLFDLFDATAPFANYYENINFGQYFPDYESFAWYTDSNYPGNSMRPVTIWLHLVNYIGMTAIFCLRAYDKELRPLCLIPIGNRYLYPLMFNDGYISGMDSCKDEFTRCQDAVCDGINDLNFRRWLNTDFFFLSFYFDTLLESNVLDSLTRFSNQEYNKLYDFLY